MAYKFTQVVMDLKDTFITVSIFEIFTLFLNVLFFLSNKNDQQIWFLIVFIIVHVLRGIVGLVISRVLPSSSYIVDKIELEGDNQLEFNKVRTPMDKQIKKIIIEHLDEYEIPAKVYTCLTLGCLVFDIIAMLIYFIFVGKYQDLFFNVVQLFFVTAYFYLDVMFMLFLLHLRFRLPNELRDQLVKALIGFGSSLRLAFDPKGTLPDFKEHFKAVFAQIPHEFSAKDVKESVNKLRANKKK